MRIITARVPGAARLARLPELTKMARHRLKWFDYYRARGHNAALTCRYFGISRQTLRYAQGQAAPPGGLAGNFHNI